MSVYLGNFDRAVRKRALQPKMVAAYGFALGVLAFWLTIPPFTTRSPIWPVLIGILAALAGVYAVTREAPRPNSPTTPVGMSETFRMPNHSETNTMPQPSRTAAPKRA